MKIRHYYHTVNYQKQRRTKRSVVKVIIVFLVLVAAAALVLWLDSKRLAKQHTPSQATKAVTTHYEAESDTFTTKYFQMETPTSWEFDDKASTQSHFVYHNVRHKLVRGTLTIYINEKPKAEQQLATHLLSVQIDADGTFRPASSVTDHCNKTASGKDRVGEQVVKLKNITFTCDNDATWYSVLLGTDGGTPEMTWKRPDGSAVKVTIHYLDSSAEPEGGSLIEVIRKLKLL
jgi:hypothetical protein